MKKSYGEGLVTHTDPEGTVNGESDRSVRLGGRVENWRAGVGRSLCSPLTRPFVCERGGSVS